MPKLITIACTLWRGNWPGREKELQTRQYTPLYVNRLYDMACRFFPRRFDFVCVTNDMSGDWRRGIRRIEMSKPLPAWWAKINIFNPDIDVNEKILHLDLDVLIVDNLTPLVNHGLIAAFCDVRSFSSLARNEKMLTPILRPNGLFLYPFYSTCAFSFTHGKLAKLYTEFDEKAIKYFKGDQDYIGKIYGDKLARFPIAWARNVNAGDKGRFLPKGPAILLACRHPVKNVDLKRFGYHALANHWSNGNDKR